MPRKPGTQGRERTTMLKPERSTNRTGQRRRQAAPSEFRHIESERPDGKVLHAPRQAREL
jgi:hypothetical protein